jgi:hypothetical protein
MKKLLITGAAAGLLLVSAAGAFAAGPGPMPSMGGSVSNNIVNSATTGLNTVTGGFFTGGVIWTGDALATVDATNIVKGDCGCTTKVSNNLLNTASTGLNKVTGGGTIVTGNAGAGVTALNVVVTKVQRGR